MLSASRHFDMLYTPAVSKPSRWHQRLHRIVFGMVSFFGLSMWGCTERVELAPDRGLDYFPVAVNRFWIYAVADTSWTEASDIRPTSTAQVSNYQFREAITATFQDAAGQTLHRVTRSKRNTPADAWVADSVFTLHADAHAVVLTRNNRKTVELVFPVRQDSLWNMNAFNNNTNDTVTAKTRRYRLVGRSFTTSVGSLTQTYPNTLTTTDEGTAKFEDSYYVKTYRQVFAKGVGPVLRHRRRFSNFYLTNPATGVNTFLPKTYFFGFTRTETLIDYGPR